MNALRPTKTFAQLAQDTNKFGTKAKNNSDMNPSADALLSFPMRAANEPVRSHTHTPARHKS